MAEGKGFLGSLLSKIGASWLNGGGGGEKSKDRIARGEFGLAPEIAPPLFCDNNGVPARVENGASLIGVAGGELSVVLDSGYDKWRWRLAPDGAAVPSKTVILAVGPRKDVEMVFLALRNGPKLEANGVKGVENPDGSISFWLQGQGTLAIRKEKDAWTWTFMHESRGPISLPVHVFGVDADGQTADFDILVEKKPEAPIGFSGEFNGGAGAGLLEIGEVGVSLDPEGGAIFRDVSTISLPGLRVFNISPIFDGTRWRVFYEASMDKDFPGADIPLRIVRGGADVSGILRASMRDGKPAIEAMIGQGADDSEILSCAPIAIEIDCGGEPCSFQFGSLLVEIGEGEPKLSGKEYQVADGLACSRIRAENAPGGAIVKCDCACYDASGTGAGDIPIRASSRFGETSGTLRASGGRLYIRKKESGGGSRLSGSFRALNMARGEGRAIADGRPGAAAGGGIRFAFPEGSLTLSNEGGGQWTWEFSPGAEIGRKSFRRKIALALSDKEGCEAELEIEAWRESPPSLEVRND